ncbi:MAG: hypothetical protein KGQ77_07120, partial [Betaproteobacteria bacterium]|nr:hypothetical protein [Betaproteobacteria bacterium]
MAGSVRKKFVTCLAGLSLALGVTLVARADEYSDVSRLVRTGQLAEALTLADKFLATKPKDAQMRFLKGVVLTEQHKPAE